MWLDDQSEDFVDSHPSWSVAQLILAAFCCMSLTAFVKVQESFYFGSGWAVIGFVLFVLLIGWPMLYIQIRLGNQYQRGILGLFKKFFPFSFGIGLAMIIRNVLSIIYISSVMTHCLSYIFFSVYPCDNRYCVGGTSFMWSNCRDEWNQKIECRPTLPKTQQGPTPEEGFYLYYNMDISNSIADIWFPRWFIMDGLDVVPHILNWVFIFLSVVWGPRILGILLYALGPLALTLFLVPFIYIVHHCSRDSNNQLGLLWDRFYRNFAATILLNKEAFDTYSYQPLIWGLLSTIVNMASTMHIFHGVWPSIGSWVPRGRKTMQFSFLPVMLLFGCIIHLPTLLAVACYAWAFDVDYLRCHVAHSYGLPFTLIPHILSRFSINKAVAVCYYISLYLFLLLAQSLLMVASTDAIVDHLRVLHRSVEQRQVRTYRLIAGITCPVLFALSFPFIIKSGYWWLRLMDMYMDRLMVLIVILSGVAFFMAYYRTKATSLVPRLLFLICLGISAVAFTAIYMWHAAAINMEPAISGCYYQQPLREVTPIPGSFRVIGWLVSLGPTLLGFVIGLVLMLCARGVGGNRCGRLFCGDFLPEETQLAQQRKQQERQQQQQTGLQFPGGAVSTMGSARYVTGGQSQQSYQLHSRPMTATMQSSRQGFQGYSSEI